jgi:hypothetical protein
MADRPGLHRRPETNPLSRRSRARTGVKRPTGATSREQPSVGSYQHSEKHVAKSAHQPPGALSRPWGARRLGQPLRRPAPRRSHPHAIGAKKKSTNPSRTRCRTRNRAPDGSLWAAMANEIWPGALRPNGDSVAAYRLGVLSSGPLISVRLAWSRRAGRQCAQGWDRRCPVIARAIQGELGCRPFVSHSSPWVRSAGMRRPYWLAIRGRFRGAPSPHACLGRRVLGGKGIP